MLTAAVRDLHRAYPRQFITHLETSAPELWENNPHVAFGLGDGEETESIEMSYPLIHESNKAPYHFIHGYVKYLEQRLNVRIPVTEFKGDIHISDQEKGWISQIEEMGIDDGFWIMMAGGKFDFTAKWWSTEAYQAVVDHFEGRIRFVQCGEASHWHPRLRGVIDLVGKTDLRQFVRLVYHADGVICPVTLAMHLAAAVETKPGKPCNRACVVIAGGREPAHWEAYPHHQFLSISGMLPCCEQGGCWKSRCQPVGDGDAKDKDLCVYPVNVAPDLQIPMCMDMVTPEDVIRRIELYYEGGMLQYNDGINAGRDTVIDESKAG